eukprot:m51a1_g3550 hypothetical protein (339) ;mRNA; f:1018581-1019597
MTRQAFYSRNLMAAVALSRQSREERSSVLIPLTAARDPTTEEEWCETARLLIREGQYTPAKHLLSEALTLASVQDNHSIFGCVFHLMALIADYEQFPEHSLELEREAQAEGGTAEFWRDSCCHVSSLACRGLADTGGDPLCAAREAEAALALAEDTLSGTPPGILRRIGRCRADIQLFMAEKQLQFNAAPRSVIDEGRRVDIVEAAESAMATMRVCAGAPRLIGATLRYSQLLQAQAASDPDALIDALERARDALVQASDLGTAALASAAPQGAAGAGGEVCIPLAKLLAAAQIELGDVEGMIWRLGGQKRQAAESNLNPVEKFLASEERPTVPTALL